MTEQQANLILFALSWTAGTLWTIRGQLARIADALERLSKGGR